MNDNVNDEFVQAFLHGSVSHSQFHHRDHLQVAWYLTMHHDLVTATKLTTTSIRTFATHHGQAQKYHETMTQFWIRLVAHLVHHHPGITDFETFLATFPHLLEQDLPYRHWRRTTILSDTARAQWVEPDVLALPSME